MKLAVRIFALSVVFAGAAAAAVSSSNAHVMVSHQSAASAMPHPDCGPGICEAPDASNNR